MIKWQHILDPRKLINLRDFHKVSRFYKLMRWVHPVFYKPRLFRGKLATGSYEGWHFYIGPLHVWDVVTHNKKRERGYSFK